MTPAGRPPRPRRTPLPSPPRGVAALRARLAEAEETLDAIRTGAVDAVVVAGEAGPQVFTLKGANQSYRILIESMNEGALILASRAVILYANECFARMVACPLERVIGGSFARFLSAPDRASLRRLLRRTDPSGAKLQVMLRGSGSPTPVQISMRPLAGSEGGGVAAALVVTDMTETRRNEEALRALSRRVVHAQEAERGRVALELHDHVTQLLCAALLRTGAVAHGLTARDGRAKRELALLRTMLGETADEVERIARGLGPRTLEHLGLVAALRAAGKEFTERTEVRVVVTCVGLDARPPGETELALYRIFQEAMRNVWQHAGARHVAVELQTTDRLIVLSIVDDGVGFDPDRHPDGRPGLRNLGLLAMRERATYTGGTLTVRSAPGRGTTIRAEIPLVGCASKG